MPTTHENNQHLSGVLATYQIGVGGAVAVGVANASWLMTVTAEASSNSPRRRAGGRALASSQMLRPIANPTTPSTGAAATLPGATQVS